MRTIQTVLAAFVSTSLAALAFVGTAAAQEAPAEQPAAALPPAEHQLPPVAAGAQPAPLAPTAKPKAGSDDEADDEDDKKGGDDDEDAPKKKKKGRDRVRFRGGVSLYGGAYIYGGAAIPYGGVEGRLGVQIKDWVAVYAEPAFLLGAVVGRTSGGAVARVSLGVIPEFTVADLWFIGAGPEAYAVIGGAADTANGGDGVIFAGGSIVGVTARTGFAFGSKRPGRRKCFTIAFDARLDFFRGNSLTTNGGGVGFAPGLSLGYDAM